MGVDVIASLAFAGISAVGAGIAAVAAVISNKKAQGSNDIAEQALGKSDKANELSERANQIAQEALEVSRSQYLRETTHEVVDWALEIDDAGVFALSNIGADSAHNVVVVITGVPEEGCESAKWRLNESRRIQDDVPAGGQVIVDTPQIRDVIEQARATFLFVPGVSDHMAHMDVEATIYWENSVGVLSTKVIQRHFD